MNIYFKEGTDLSSIIGVSKYDPEYDLEQKLLEKKRVQEKSKLKKFLMRYSLFRRLFLSRSQKQGFPYWVSKTDEERIQSMPHVLEQFKDKRVYITEKIDYQSATFTGKMVPRFTWLGKFSPKKYQFVVCSRNLTVTDKNSLYWKIAKKYNLEKILSVNPTLTIQGEQGDTNVQGNKYGITGPRLWVFNIIDHETGKHYDQGSIAKFCFDNRLEYVPWLSNIGGLIYFPRISDVGTTVEDWVKLSIGKSVLADTEREGIVVRCIEDGKKLLSFKVINPKFLLNHDL